MNVQSKTSKCTNELDSPSPDRRSRTDRIEAVLSAAQDLHKTEDRAAGKLAVATVLKRTATNYESCSNPGVADVHAPDKLSSNNQQAQQAAVSKSTNKSNIALPSSKVLDDSLIQFEKKQERPIVTFSDAEQQPDEPPKRNSATANDVISCDAVRGLLPPSWIVALNEEDDGDHRRRRANFVNKRKRHDNADSLQARYNAIFAEIFAAVEADEDDEEEEEPQQDNNSEENTDSFHDLFIIMEVDGEVEDDRESD